MYLFFQFSFLLSDKGSVVFSNFFNSSLFKIRIDGMIYKNLFSLAFPKVQFGMCKC